MDAETRHHLADLRRKQQGRTTAAERARQEAERAVAAWNKQYDVGTEVDVTRDDGSVMTTKTRSGAWLVSGHASVLLEGISGGYSLERVLPRPRLQPQACDHAEWVDSVDVARRPIRTCSGCGIRLAVMNLTIDDVDLMLDLVDLRTRWYEARFHAITKRRRLDRLGQLERLRARVKELRRG